MSEKIKGAVRHLHASEQRLPQTSESSAQGIATVGFIGLLASLFGLTGAKKRRQNL